MLVGYILPDKHDEVASSANEDSENEEEEEEEKQPEFLDMTEMDAVGSGECVYKKAAPALREVELMVGGRTLRVLGRFALRDPWWEISCTALKQKHRSVLKGYPAYRLRTDLKEQSRSIVSLFLKACGADPNLVTCFMGWLPENRHLELTNLQEALMDFRESNKEMKTAADYTISAISKSDAGFNVRAAIMYPNFMKYVPTLLPGRFLDLLKKEKEEERKRAEETGSTEAPPQNLQHMPLLVRLEKLIHTDVWKFGFGYIMHKEFHLIRCEAKVSAFKESRLFEKLDQQQQNALMVYEELKIYCRKFGHTYIDRERLHKNMRAQKFMQEESTWEAVDFLRKKDVVVVERQKVALRNLYDYEMEITHCLHLLMTREPWKIDLDVKEVLLSAQRNRMKAKSLSAQAGEEHVSAAPSQPRSFNDSMNEEPEPIELDPDQVRAAEVMCTKPVTVISGKGGCGKTTVVSLIFKAAMECQNSSEELNSTCEESEEKDKKPQTEVLLTAPTGRAASLLTSKTSFTAYTMHQVLWSYMTAEKHKNGEPVNWKFASVRVLVVDEGSLVCVQMLDSILTMLIKYAQLQKFIILGDVRQLPSIDPGNVLNDLFDSLHKVGSAIEMRTNHRAESELIVHNAGLIADMGVKKKYRSLHFDAIVDMSRPIMPSPDKRFILISLPKDSRDDDLQSAINALLNGRAPGLEDDRSSQFVAFRRTECSLINELCCKHYSDHVTMTHKRKINFQIGDKVCCTKNGYVSDRDKEEQRKSKGQEKDLDGNQSKERNHKERLCNGEIFFIRQDVTEEDVGKSRSKKRYLMLEDGQGRVVVADFRELNRECKLRHAWARTIHTFQGSEAETIVYVLGDGKAQTWKHVYTAVTRGQKRVYVIVKEDGMRNAIESYVIKRCTRLSALTTELVHKLGIPRDQALTQMTQPHLQSSKNGPSSQFCRPSQPLSQSSVFSQPGFNMTEGARGHFQGDAGQNFLNSGSGFSELIAVQPEKPSPCKRQSSQDICVTPSKQQKTTEFTDSPLGCSRMGRLSLSSLAPKPQPKKLFTELPTEQSRQNNPYRTT